jgi:hypothetical protein
MGAGDVVAIREVCAHADGARLLSDVEMHEPGKLTRCKELLDTLLE